MKKKPSKREINEWCSHVGMLNGIAQNIQSGAFAVVWFDINDEPVCRLTRKGKEQAKAMIAEAQAGRSVP